MWNLDHPHERLGADDMSCAPRLISRRMRNLDQPHHALRAPRYANLFGCAAARNKGTCLNRLNIRRDALEAIVLDGLKARLMDPELFKVFAQEFVAEVNRLRGHEGARVEQLKRELEQTEKRIRRIGEAIAEGVPARSLKHELLALKRRQEELEREIARTAEPRHLLHRRALSAEGGRAGLADPDDGAGAMEMSRALVDLVLLTPEGRKAAHRPDRRAAAILSIAQSGARRA
jgi:hypothetical protein